MDSETQLDEIDLAMKLSEALQAKARLNDDYIFLQLFAIDGVAKCIEMFQYLGTIDPHDSTQMTELVTKMKEFTDSMGDIAALINYLPRVEKETMDIVAERVMETFEPDTVKTMIKQRERFSHNCGTSLTNALGTWLGEDKTDGED